MLQHRRDNERRMATPQLTQITYLYTLDQPKHLKNYRHKSLYLKRQLVDNFSTLLIYFFYSLLPK